MRNKGAGGAGPEKQVRAVALVGFGLLVILLGASMISAWVMSWPFRYYTHPPTDRAKRETLIKRITGELQQWREQDKTPEGQASAKDADRQWPLERLPIVLAVETYYLQRGETPANIEALIEAGLLDDRSLADRYRLVVAKEKWELHKTAPRDFLTAVGN